MKKRNPKDLVNDAKNETNEADVAKAQAEAARWKKLRKESLARELELERRLDVALAIEAETPIPIAFGASKQPVGKRVAAVVPATDWHVEEQVSAEATDGKNHFDLAEAERRIQRFYAGVLELIDYQNYQAKVAELWHPLLGDLMSGYIHEELMETNALSPTETVVFLQEMLIGGIDLILKKTRLPIFLPTCVGNHGRTTPKKRIKTSYKNSYEWLMYRFLARYYEKRSRVRFMIGKGYHNIQTVMGRRVRFHHGDGLRYQGGVGGISIPVNKAVAQWDKVLPCDFDIFGHWHTFLPHYPKWISCGSLMGYSEYSVEIKAEFQHPTQTFIVIDQAYGLVDFRPIFLTDAKGLTELSAAA